MNKKTTKNKTSNAPNLQEKSLDFSNSIITIIIALYLLVECMPQVKIQDQMGMHWLTLSILNVLSLSYIFTNKSLVNHGQLKLIFKNLISIPYLLFFAIAGLSLIVALNPIEGMVVYNRLFTSMLAFFIIGVLLFNKLHLLKNIALIITIIALAQGFNTISQFYKGVDEIQLDTLISNLQGTTGNKNVFAAAFIIKLPFIIYTIFIRDGYLKILAILGLAFSVFAIFLISARAAFLGLILELGIIGFGVGYIYLREKQVKKLAYKFAYIFSVLVGSFLISQHSLKKAAENTTSQFGTFASRLGTLAEQNTAETNIRLAYWEKSIDLIKEKPFIGVGYGNWKLYTPLYTNTLLNDNLFSKHPHNDFIEIAGETGVLNALIFLSIFIFAAWLTVKTVISNRSFDAKVIAVFAFAALSGYFIDAFFNFPAERPNIQLLFALTLAVLIANWLAPKSLDNTVSVSKPIKLFLGFTILLGFASIYVNAMVFTSSKAQYIVDNDLAAIDNIPNALPKYKFNEVDKMFPYFPNIGENSETIGYKKTKYLQKEKRFKEAIKLLDSVHSQMPNLAYGNYLKCNIYLEENNLDSAYKYGKIAAYAKPRHFYYFRMASYLAMMHKDAKEVQKLFHQYNRYRKDQQSYSYYAQSLFYSGYSRSEVRAVLLNGLKLYPTDETMLGIIATLP